MPFAEVLVIIMSQAKKVVARCRIVSFYSAINSLIGLGGKVAFGLSQKIMNQPHTCWGTGAMPQNGNFLHGIAPNGIIYLEIYIKNMAFAHPK